MPFGPRTGGLERGTVLRSLSLALWLTTHGTVPCVRQAGLKHVSRKSDVRDGSARTKPLRDALKLLIAFTNHVFVGLATRITNAYRDLPVQNRHERQVWEELLGGMAFLDARKRRAY